MGDNSVKKDQFWPILYRKRWNWAGRSRWMSLGLGALWSKQNWIGKVLKWRNFAQMRYKPLKFGKIGKNNKTLAAVCEFQTYIKVYIGCAP